MVFFQKMVALQAQLFLLLVVGFVCRKIKLIELSGRKTLSNLLINVILPCNIIASFTGSISVTPQFFTNCAVVLLISALTQVFAVLISKPLFRRFPLERKNIMTYAMICSNSSFIGLPLAEALFDNLGVMYTSIFQIPLRFQMWTSGLSLFARTKSTWKENLKKLALHPCIIAVFLGLGLMVFGLKVPGVLGSTVSALSRCTTPVSMLVIGSILADTDMKTAFAGPVLYCSFLRLIAFPLFLYAVLTPLQLDPTIVGINVLLGAVPAGNTTAILADKYDCDPKFASQIVFTSTLLSLITLPIISFLL